jgi:acyl-CoA thioesterase
VSLQPKRIRWPAKKFGSQMRGGMVSRTSISAAAETARRTSKCHNLHCYFLPLGARLACVFQPVPKC